jgi:hypothetical protein
MPFYSWKYYRLTTLFCCASIEKEVEKIGADAPI